MLLTHRRRARVHPTLAAGAALLALAFAPGSQAASRAAVTLTPAPAPVLSVSTSCFNATGPDGRPVTIFGRRYAVGHPTSATPAVVLVHGIESNADDWDFVPSWSVARWLAYAGYVVIAYDELGYRNSPYSGVGGGYALTVGAQQVVLHEIVESLHAGSYATGSTSTCSGAGTRTPSTYASARVALIGHSAGGFIVAGYPGTYHDVAAMIQADAPSGELALSPPGDPALGALTGAGSGDDSQDDRYGPIGDPSGDGNPTPASSDYTYAFSTRAGCENFFFWRAGAVPAVATAACRPQEFTPTPQGEVPSYVDQAAENIALIRQTGDTPVLLTSGAQDPILPSDQAHQELAAWQENCGCDVSQLILPDTGHLFMGHRSLVQWTTYVVAWFRAHDFAAALPGRVSPGVDPPQACAPVHAAVRLLTPASRSRRVLVLVGSGPAFVVPRGHRRVSVTIPYRGRPTGTLTILTRVRRGRPGREFQPVSFCQELS